MMKLIELHRGTQSGGSWVRVEIAGGFAVGLFWPMSLHLEGKRWRDCTLAEIFDWERFVFFVNGISIEGHPFWQFRVLWFCIGRINRSEVRAPE